MKKPTGLGWWVFKDDKPVSESLGSDLQAQVGKAQIIGLLLHQALAGPAGFFLDGHQNAIEAVSLTALDVSEGFHGVAVVAVIEAALSAELEGDTMIPSAGPQGGMGVIVVVIVSIEDGLAVGGDDIGHGNGFLRHSGLG